MRIARYQAEALQAVERSSARIASGRRFTSFAEDTVAATREISLRAQQGATGLYLRAAQDAGSAAEAAASGLRSASDILGDLRNAVLALNTADPTSVTATQRTVTALTDELTRLSTSTTTVAGKSLLDGSIASAPLTFRVGAGGSASDEVQLTAISVAADQLGSASLKLNAIDFTGGAPTDQNDALDAIDEARSAVTDSLTSTAAVSSAMTYHATALGTQYAAVDTALDTLVGVDAAQEAVTLTRARLQAETSAALLAQINTLQTTMVRHLLMNI
ncbi:flagellin [Paractinoplanes atraurantiacus]|nr:flagellin [Actinoplanes atraurantiacus]